MIDEGYTKYACDWQRTAPLSEAAVAELNLWRNRLHEAGLVGYYEQAGVGYGNVSIRAGGREFIISGTQTGHIAQTGVEHYARVIDYSIGGNRVTCRGPVQASSEALTHAALYELNGAIGGIAHVHSARLWQAYLDQLPTTNSAVAYGTPAMAGEFRRLYRETSLAETGVAVMGGHAEGVVAFGAGIAEAANRILALAGSAPGHACGP
jgi:ribulose-5-phosphate 4-epimerase/fuculose-1-phosphate aldolase